MNVYRLLFLVAVCITSVILQAKGEGNLDTTELDEEFESPNIREKRHSFYSWRLFKCTDLGRLICRKLKEVDCRENKFCQRAQICCFGEIFVPPTPTPPPTPPMTSSPTPMVTVTPSPSVMPMSPTNMVTPTPAASSMNVASSV
ncbi:hypothetical protein ACROYT_G005493 [Oculina patagonica]